MSQAESVSNLTIQPRATTTVNVAIPTEALDDLGRVAALRDMSTYALLKLYIGQGLRQDVARLFSERVLDLTAQVLSRHG